MFRHLSILRAETLESVLADAGGIVALTPGRDAGIHELRQPPELASSENQLAGNKINDSLFFRTQSCRFLAINYHQPLLRQRHRFKVKNGGIVAFVQVVPNFTSHDSVIPRFVVTLGNLAPQDMRRDNIDKIG